MKIVVIITLFLLSVGCREFYDEEFSETDVSTSELLNRTYTASLLATDASVNLSGESEVAINDGEVNVTLDVGEIPANILQLHYGIISPDCSALSIAIPSELGSTRSVSLRETSSVEALQFDLRSSGAIPSGDSLDLEGKSFVVYAFSNFSGLPNATGTNSLAIACGRMEVSSSDSSDNTSASDVDPEVVQ